MRDEMVLTCHNSCLWSSRSTVTLSFIENASPSGNSYHNLSHERPGLPRLFLYILGHLTLLVTCQLGLGKTMTVVIAMGAIGDIDVTNWRFE